MSKALLIVDDEQDLRELITDLLTEEGYHCLTAGSAEEALAMASEYVQTGGQIELVISDVNMPKGSGLDLLKDLREKGIQSPFLFLSGDIMDATFNSFTNMGVMGYQLKPFRTIELLKRVQTLLKSLSASA